MTPRVDEVAGKGFPRRGDVYDVDLDPVVGSETGKRRPAVIVSTDLNNEYSETVTVLPITGQPAKKEYPLKFSFPEASPALPRIHA